MLRARVSLPGVDGDSPDADVMAMLGALVPIWSRWLRVHPTFPELYSAGVRYRPEVDTEDWLSPPEVLAQKWGDCEDLTLWRCAELMARNVRCSPICIGRRSPLGGLTQHVLVSFPDGATEDPSLILLPKSLKLR
jgi:hypothetical protein